MFTHIATTARAVFVAQRVAAFAVGSSSRQIALRTMPPSSSFSQASRSTLRLATNATPRVEAHTGLFSSTSMSSMMSPFRHRRFYSTLDSSENEGSDAAVVEESHSDWAEAEVSDAEISMASHLDEADVKAELSAIVDGMLSDIPRQDQFVPGSGPGRRPSTKASYYRDVLAKAASNKNVESYKAHWAHMINDGVEPTDQMMQRRICTLASHQLFTDVAEALEEWQDKYPTPDPTHMMHTLSTILFNFREPNQIALCRQATDIAIANKVTMSAHPLIYFVMRFMRDSRNDESRLGYVMDLLETCAPREIFDAHRLAFLANYPVIAERVRAFLANYGVVPPRNGPILELDRLSKISWVPLSVLAESLETVNKSELTIPSGLFDDLVQVASARGLTDLYDQILELGERSGILPLNIFHYRAAVYMYARRSEYTKMIRAVNDMGSTNHIPNLMIEYLDRRIFRTADSDVILKHLMAGLNTLIEEGTQVGTQTFSFVGRFAAQLGTPSVMREVYQLASEHLAVDASLFTTYLDSFFTSVNKPVQLVGEDDETVDENVNDQDSDDDTTHDMSSFDKDAIIDQVVKFQQAGCLTPNRSLYFGLSTLFRDDADKLLEIYDKIANRKVGSVRFSKALTIALARAGRKKELDAVVAELNAQDIFVEGNWAFTICQLLGTEPTPASV